MPFRQLPPLLAKKAKEEICEEPSRNDEGIRMLREWAQKQPHLKARLDDQFLLTVVRASKHRLERAKKKLDLFYTVRTALPEVYRNRRTDDPKVWEIMNLGVYLPLPQTLGEDGPTIVIIRPGLVDPTQYNLYDIARPATMIQDIRFMDDDNAVIAGIVQIVDVSGMTMAHFLHINLIFMKKMAILSGEGLLLRQKGLHFINIAPIFEKVFNLLKSFMTEKQKTRTYVHSNMESLYHHIPQKMLPREYGGENGSLEECLKNYEKLFAKYYDYFVEEDNFGAEDALRSPDSKFNPEALDGGDGTFRRLEVD